jgi:hypothetical protein
LGLQGELKTICLPRNAEAGAVTDPVGVFTYEFALLVPFGINKGFTHLGADGRKEVLPDCEYEGL